MDARGLAVDRGDGDVGADVGSSCLPQQVAASGHRAGSRRGRRSRRAAPAALQRLPCAHRRRALQQRRAAPGRASAHPDEAVSSVAPGRIVVADHGGEPPRLSPPRRAPARDRDSGWRCGPAAARRARARADRRRAPRGEQVQRDRVGREGVDAEHVEAARRRLGQLEPRVAEHDPAPRARSGEEGEGAGRANSRAPPGRSRRSVQRWPGRRSRRACRCRARPRRSARAGPNSASALAERDGRRPSGGRNRWSAAARAPGRSICMPCSVVPWASMRGSAVGIVAHRVDAEIAAGAGAVAARSRCVVAAALARASAPRARATKAQRHGASSERRAATTRDAPAAAVDGARAGVGSSSSSAARGQREQRPAPRARSAPARVEPGSRAPVEQRDCAAPAAPAASDQQRMLLGPVEHQRRDQRGEQRRRARRRPTSRDRTASAAPAGPQRRTAARAARPRPRTAAARWPAPSDSEPVLRDGDREAAGEQHDQRREHGDRRRPSRAASAKATTKLSR